MKIFGQERNPYRVIPMTMWLLIGASAVATAVTVFHVWKYPVGPICLLAAIILHACFLIWYGDKARQWDEKHKVHEPPELEEFK